MSLLQLVRTEVGEVGVRPGKISMFSTDNLTTITTAGYLNGAGNQLSLVQLSPLDVIECMYSYNPSTGSATFAILTVTISAGVITLTAWDNPNSEPLPSAQIFVGNASNVATARAMTGDISITNTGVTAIVAGVIVNADINAAAAIAFSKLAALPSAQILVGSAGNVATAVAMSGVIAISNTGATSIVAGSIVNADINAAAAIDFSKLATLTSGNILVGSAGNVATSVAMSGDATIIASGALTIANDAITTVKILNANVTLDKLASGIAPSHVIKFANQLTTVGGAAAEAFTVTGAVGATDRAFVQVVNDGTGNVTVLEAAVTDNTLTITFSANPGNDCVFNYQIIRAAS